VRRLPAARICSRKRISRIVIEVVQTGNLGCRSSQFTTSRSAAGRIKADGIEDDHPLKETGLIL
jgi:hypothetical protein